MLSSSSLTPAETLYQNALCILESDLDCSDDAVEDMLLAATRLRHPYAVGELGIIQFFKASNNSETSIALRNILRGAGNGHALSWYFAGYCFFNLELPSLKNDTQKAIEHYLKFIQHVDKLQAEKKSNTRLDFYHLTAIVSVGNIYLLIPDNSKAAVWFARGERMGHLRASHQLAIIIISKNRNIACTLEAKKSAQKLWLGKLSKLAEQEYAEALFELAYYYAEGDTMPHFVNVEKDIPKAINLYWRAGIGGKSEAFYRLVKIYENLNDAENALKALILASKTGIKEATFEYAEYLYDNEELSEDERALGLDYMHSLAEVYIPAQARLGIINLQKFLQTREQLYWSNAITYLVNAKDHKNYIAMYYLAELLMLYPCTDTLLAFNEAKDCLEELNQLTGKNRETYANLIKNVPMLINLVQAKIIEEKEQISRVNAAREEEKKSKNNQLKYQHRKKSAKKLYTPEIAKRSQVVYEFDADKHSTETLGILEEQLNFKLFPLVRETQIKKAIKKVARKSLYRKAVNVVAQKPDDIKEEPVLLNSAVIEQLPKAMPLYVTEKLQLLESKGYCAYVVGGFTRNSVLQIETVFDDIDLVTDAPVALIEQLFSTKENVFVKDLCRFTHNSIRYDIKHISDLKDNLAANASKRDFTINTLYADSAGRVYDPLARGFKDLNNPECQLVTVINQEESFKIDPFRILRYQNLMAAGFRGTYSDASVTKYLKNILESFHKFKTMSNPTETDLQTKISITEHFDMMFCKFFMSGKAYKTFIILLKTSYFKIFFGDVCYSPESEEWLCWRLANMDEAVLHSSKKGLLSKKNLYAIFFAAMMDADNDFEKLKPLLEEYPFPYTLRWELTPEIVLAWKREKMIFEEITPDFREIILTTSANSQLSEVFYQCNPGSIATVTHNESARMNGYQQFGQFGRSSRIPAMSNQDIAMAALTQRFHSA